MQGLDSTLAKCKHNSELVSTQSSATHQLAGYFLYMVI